MTGLTLGCGLLVERVAGLRLPGALLPPVGLCAVAIVGQFTTLADATAELTVPIVIALSAAGLMLSWPVRARRLDRWAAVAAAGAFLVYGAPVLLSGEATFAGYIRLDDTASWLALAERAMDQGSNVSGLAPSTYEATLDFYLNSDYPLGGLIPLGVGGDLVGQDYAWVWQPYLSTLAGMLALGLYVVLAELGVRAAPRALMAVLAAQPALVVGYALWGGFKEVAAAALVVVVAALGARAASERLSGRRLLPLAVASAGVLAVLSLGGGIWLAPVLLPVVVAWFRASRPSAVRQSLWLGGVVAALSAPTLLAVGFLGAPAASTITDRERLANLIEPLSPLQVFGIWPAGDFRLRPDELGATHVLIALAAIAGLIGAVAAWRQRRWTLLLYAGAAVGGCVAIVSLGSPWVDAKALAVASPAVVLVVLAGVAFVYASGRRVEALVLAAAVAGGVVWSNVLAYHTANLAPRERMAELERIGKRIAGHGPTLLTEYEPYGARYFLRDADPESAGELRRRQVRLRSGGTVRKGGYADLDQFLLPEVLVYRTLVLRRSPTASRPPGVYRLTLSGRHYEVWERPEVSAETILEHLPLGDELRAVEVAPCGIIQRLMRRSKRATRLASVPRSPATIVDLAAARRPSSWEPDGGRVGAVQPTQAGVARASLSLAKPGRYEVWLGGEVRGKAAIEIDGQPVGDVRHSLSYPGHYTPVGAIDLRSGRHEATVRYHAGDLHPGSGGDAESLGPLVLSLAEERRESVFLPSSRGKELCGTPLDWVELLRFYG